MRKNIVIKSLRSMWRNKKSYISCIMVLAIGLSVFMGMFSAAKFFGNSIDTYYEQTNFADVFASVLSMPENSLYAIREIEGIKEAEGKLTKNIKATVDGVEDIVSIKLIGVNLDQPKNVNQYSYEGIAINGLRDIWLGKEFYTIHNYKQGDTIDLIINGKKQQFNICGYISSPEYVIVMPDDGSFPNNRTTTIGFVESAVVEESSNMTGMVTDIAITLKEGYQFEDVKIPLQELLKKYGLKSIVPRADNASNQILQGNIATLSMIATIIPILFLVMSVMMLYILLKRFIEQERGEIGTLKAFGFSSLEVISGYLLYGVITGLAGFVISLFLGKIVGDSYYNMLLGFFNLPSMKFHLLSQVCMQGLAFSMVTSILAVITGAMSVIHIEPAEAMRAAVPSLKSSNLNLDKKVFKMMLTSRGAMAIRAVLRSRFRSSLTILSIALSFTIINFLLAFGIAVVEITGSQTSLVETSDIKVNLEDFTAMHKAVKDAKSMVGVTDAEALFIVPVTLKNKNIENPMSIYGLSPESEMYNIIDQSYNKHDVKANELILSQLVANKMNASVGDSLEVESPYLKENIYITVSEIVAESIGAGCYMEISTLSHLFGKELVANTLLLQADHEEIPLLKQDLIFANNVIGYIDSESTARENMEGNASTLGILNMLTLMSVVMCFGAVYNVSRISLGEKQRELATMRILGFTVSEVAEINSFEHWLLFIVGSIIGIIMSYYTSGPLSSLFNSEYGMYDVSITLISTLQTAFCCMAAVFLSNILGKKQIEKYDLVEVLKERE